MASPEKRCLYEVLGLQRDCTADEIRSAYKKLALQRHPDKLVQSGVSQSEATASFQELVNAYEVLSDARERAWYDSHRSQILFSSNSSNSSTVVPDLFSFFSNSVFSGYSDTGKGFYKVYGDVFDKIYQNELNFAKKLGLGLVKEAPLMGNLESPYAQVNAFYGYWLGFVTVMDFVWADQYDAMAGPNRKSRRVMEEENKKIRKKARREYNETVRGLAEFVKKRDKRVIDMQVKRNEEMERKKEKERERKRELEREKAERARAYEEPKWAEGLEEEVVEDEMGEEGEKKEELYCMACGKKFKSEKQWKNHEQSKKHKEKVAELREAFRGEERETEDEMLSGNADDEVDNLRDQFVEVAGILEQEHYDHHESDSIEEEEIFDIDNGEGLKAVAEELGLDDDDERSILEAMLSGHKSRKTRKTKNSPKNVHVEVEIEEIDLMEYNNRKGSRRNRGGQKEKGKRVDEEGKGGNMAETSSKAEEDNGQNDGLYVEDPSSSHPCAENEGDLKGDDEQPGRSKVSKQAHAENEGDHKGDNEQSGRSKVSKQAHTENEGDHKGGNERSGSSKVSKQTVDSKATTRKDATVRSKNASRGQKQKATSKNSGHECDTCGEDFESRNKLHKHLSDTGHATLKSR